AKTARALDMPEGAAAASAADGFETEPAWTGKRALRALTGGVDQGSGHANKESRTRGKGCDEGCERLEEAVTYECSELGADKPMATLATQAGKGYSEDAQQLKDRHATDSAVDLAALGPPHLVVVASVTKGIKGEVPPEDKPILSQLWQKVVCLEDPELLGTCVKHYQAKTNEQPKQNEEKVRRIFSSDLHVPDVKAVREVLAKEIRK
ncbi:unnamed protein product, partial [Prorocentrum cordatum]